MKRSFVMFCITNDDDDDDETFISIYRYFFLLPFQKLVFELVNQVINVVILFQKKKRKKINLQLAMSKQGERIAMPSIHEGELLALHKLLIVDCVKLTYFDFPEDYHCAGDVCNRFESIMTNK